MADDRLGHIHAPDWMRRLRKQLGACDIAVETVVGVGYRFVGCDDSAPAA